MLSSRLHPTAHQSIRSAASSTKLKTALPRRYFSASGINYAIGVSPTKIVNVPRPTNNRLVQVSSHLTSPSLSSSTTIPHQTRSHTTMAQQTLPTRGGFDPKASTNYTARKVGAPHTLEHRVYIEKDGVPVSPFHDIPLYANEQQTILNMVVEIPRWTNAKQEVR